MPAATSGHAVLSLPPPWIDALRPVETAMIQRASHWRTSGIYPAILTPLYTTQVLSAPFAILEILERQDLLIVRGVLRIALLALAIGVAPLLALPALWAVVLLSTAGTWRT
jgi:hypothetical protein